MKKALLISLVIFGFCGFGFKDSGSTLINYIRVPIDLAVDTAARAMRASVDLIVRGATASTDGAVKLYDHVSVR